MKKFLLLFAFLFSAPLCRAEVTPCPCSFALEGELLIWSPLVDTPFLVSHSDSTLIDTDFPLDQSNFKPGFRINGFFAYDPCNLFEVRFAYFDGGRHRRIPVSGVFNILNTASFVSGNIDFKVNTRYYGTDFTLQNFNCSCGNINVNFIEGLHYFWARDIHNLKGFSDTVYIVHSDKSQAWGVGPEVGLNASYHLLQCNCGNFGIIVNARGALLASLKHGRRADFNSLLGTPQAFYRAKKWLVTPMFDTRIGFEWNTSWSCFDAYLEIGYEFLWYRSAFLRPDANMPSGFANFIPTDLGFHGPYFSIGTTF